MFEPTFIKSSDSVDTLIKELDRYENGLNKRATTLKNFGKTVSDQDFECCAFSLENSGDSHLLLLGGMGPAAGVHGMRDALKICSDSSITLFQACSMPKRTTDTNITPMLKSALKSALKYCPKEKQTKLVVLCNSAHRFMGDVLKDDEIKSRIEFYSLKSYVEKNHKIFEEIASVALQTHFSAQNCIYGQTPSLRSLHEIPELAMLQVDLTAAIEGVKSFDKHKVVQNGVNVFGALKKWGAQQLLLGCTELPVMMDYLSGQIEGIELVNPLHLVLNEIKNEGLA